MRVAGSGAGHRQPHSGASLILGQESSRAPNKSQGSLGHSMSLHYSPSLARASVVTQPSHWDRGYIPPPLHPPCQLLKLLHASDP